MATKSTPPATAGATADVLQTSWLPLIIIVIAQIQMAFNVNAIPVSIGPIVDDLGVSPTAVGTTLVVYSLFVAGFVLVGAKLGKMVGERLAFQVTALIHGAAMALMALSTSDRMMNVAQGVAGLAAAILVPSLVVLIAANYHGKQQAQALGILAGSPAISGALAFFLAGWLGTALSWRISFGMLAVVAVVVFVLSFRLNPVPRQKGIKLDFVGAVLAAVAIALISIGFNNLNAWGLVVAKPEAPIAPLGLSPAPFMVVIGIVLVQAFFGWSELRVQRSKAPLLALEVIGARPERMAIVTLLIIGALGPAVNFLIPLYIQIVQDRTSLFTAVAVIPYTLSIAASAMLIVRLYSRLTPRQIGATGLILVAVGLTLLAFTIQNGWGTPVVILGLIVVGLGEGSLLTLLFNVLVSGSPKELAGDVGALRGVANNLSTALGTAFAGVVAVGLLSLFIVNGLVNNPVIPPELKVQVNLDNVNFVSNAQLESVLSETTATPEQVAEAVRINEVMRLRALKAAFLILAAIALLGIFPALGLPKYDPSAVPDLVAEPPKKQAKLKPRPA
jgi:MFS family permease